ncbi:MAG: peptidyl-prolyl cis-trans isomerase [Hydrogenophilus thermoluteolus]|nr:peptidylprolyl isomerase [Rhodocyclaceae bacterium]HNQ48561.1 peptidylprolyl isomerase [Hydrogenophilus thermoluteolus]HNU20218.1 peptidylprolyl isomerase [Hydrogenophilus thermoluteolus]
MKTISQRMIRLTAASVIAGAFALPLWAGDVAKVNGQAIPESHLQAILDKQIEQGQKDTPELREAIREELVRRVAIEQAAKKAGLDKDAKVQAEMALAKQGVLLRHYLTQYMKDHPVTDAELQAAYEKIKKAFAGNEYHVRHILFESESAAKQAIADLKSGKVKWEELAKQSKDPGSREKGGDLGWATPEMFVKPFSDAMTQLKKGEMTEQPVKSEFGWHVIRLDDVRPQTPPALESIREQLTQQLQQQKMERHIEELVAKAKVQ